MPKYTVAIIKKSWGLFDQVDGTEWVTAKNMRVAVRKYARQHQLKKGTSLSVRTEAAIKRPSNFLAVQTWIMKSP